MSPILKSFHGGAHPPESKELTAGKPMVTAKVPDEVIIPMSMHIGAPCKPIVKKGDHVYVGQKIGEAQGFVSVPIHSSVSGTVKAVEERQHPNGEYVKSVVIENDGLDEPYPEIVIPPNYTSMKPEEVIEFIKESGLVGIGGATFPTHVKLSVPPDKTVDTAILNGAECEPYITCDDRLMRDYPEKVIEGLKIIMYVLGVDNGKIGIEDNKPEAIASMTKAAENEPNIEVVPLKTKYPQGAEKQLITAITGREVPSGGLPADAGVVVCNVGTAAQIATSFETGMPFYQTILTCTGEAVNDPQTMLVRLGTPFQEVIDQCGGFKEEPGKIISGGPMMGVAQFTTEVPVIKSTSGILCFTQEQAQLPEPTDCIKCGKCIEVCPIRLQPYLMSQYSLLNDWDECELLNVKDCIECGSCSFVCPAKRPLLSSFRTAKRSLAKRGNK